jgi:SAM-dependent methyltransferase
MAGMDSPEAAPGAAAAPPELDAIRRALTELRRTSDAVGQLPPEPPTFRGRMGARLVRLIRRALFWYTPRLVQFNHAAVQAHEEQGKVLEAVVEQLRQSEVRWREETRALAARAAEQASGLRARLEAVEKQLAELRSVVLPGADASRRLDEFYLRLEEEFRGSEQTIKERLSAYLPVVDQAIAGPNPSIVDIGCGRGEWLGLLRDRGWNPLGIDRNSGMVRLCEDRGLRVLREDALTYLESLDSDSQDVVTAFHFIEHLPFETLLELLSEIFRVLKPSGVAILETPNPRNLSMGARYFYLDPTHRHPIPSELGRLLAQTQGFEQVEIMELNPWPESHHVKPGDSVELAGRFNEMFYGPQDYGVVAWKTARGPANPEGHV